MGSQYEVLLFDAEGGGVKAVVPGIPGCEALGTTDAEVLTNVRKALNDTLRRVRRAMVEVEMEPPAAEEDPLPFTDKELQDIAARGPDDPRYWAALEAVAERFNASLDRKGYTLEKMLADLPAARQSLWEQKYAPLLEKARKAQGTDE